MEKTLFLIEFTEHVQNVQLPTLDKSVKIPILEAIRKKLSVDPYAFGKPLTKQWKNHYRLRVGAYRVIYRIEDATVTVLIVEIDHRKDVYKD